MSDFLSQLADRALASSPLVRPRLQSIYEPSAPSGLPNPLEENVEVPATPPRMIESVGEQTLQSRDDKAGPKPAGEGIEQKPAPRQERKVDAQLSPEQPVFRKADAPRSVPLPDETESAGETETAEPKTPEHRMAPKEDRPLERVEAARTKQPVALRARPKTSAADRSMESDLETHQRTKEGESAQPQSLAHESKPRVEKQAVHPTVVAVQTVRQPSEKNALPTVPLIPAPREQRPPASAPAVHIAIGRVEIRAILPPASEPRPAPQSSSARFSLDEYLKRNAGAAR